MHGGLAASGTGTHRQGPPTEQGQPLCSPGPVPCRELLLARPPPVGRYSDFLPFWHRNFFHFSQYPGAQKLPAPGFSQLRDCSL